MASQVSFKSGAQQPDLDYEAVDGYLWGSAEPVVSRIGVLGWLMPFERPKQNCT
jgi:hypothetical protein